MEEAIETLERLMQADQRSSTPKKRLQGRAAKKRNLSPSGRKRLADSMRKRWAVKRKSAGTTKKKSVEKRTTKVT